MLVQRKKAGNLLNAPHILRVKKDWLFLVACVSEASDQSTNFTHIYVGQHVYIV